MTSSPPAVLDRYVGDDWTIGPITLTAGGQPVNLTGATVTAVFYVRDQALPALTLTETAVDGVGGLSVAADRTQGVITEAWIAAAATSAVKAQDRRDWSFPTRLALVVTDSLQRERTFLIVLFRALDRRVDIPPLPSST